MAELAQSTNLLYIGRTREEFLAHIDQALKEDDPQLRKARVDYAKANTWGVRVDAIDAAVRAAFPRISVLIVTYNSEEFIGPCLDSVLSNTAAPGLEVIVVDNASTDRTREILERYPEVRAFRQSRNLGFAGGNNLAARDATPLLVDGVTGGGRTTVYIEAIAAALEAGRSALVLVPEIALAMPLVDRLRADLNASVSLVHSGLSDGERAELDRHGIRLPPDELGLQSAEQQRAR